MEARSPRVLLAVSATVEDQPTAPPGPRKDYTALREALGAELLDYRALRRSRGGRLLSRLFGRPVAQAWLAFARRRDYDAILTDGEHIGIPLALLLGLARDDTVHICIGHRLTTPKKWPFFRWLQVHRRMAKIVVHARTQLELAGVDLGIPSERLALVPYQVDPVFWSPRPVDTERLVCSAGLEHRDYPTLMRAVAGLDARVVIAAASHWSRQPNTAADADRPANVEVGSFDYFALRELYARAAVVVVPLYDVDFQAGVTTLLEAMAMGKAVVVSHSAGQTDVVEDRRQVTRGPIPRVRPISLVRLLAESAGEPLEPNGFYVPTGDPVALRSSLAYLLDHPAERERLGQAGRRLVERLLTVDQFAARLADLLREAVAAAGRSGDLAVRAEPA